MLTIEAINEARVRVQNTVHLTPVLSSHTLDNEIGANVFIKGEHLQKTGSFKIRGAANRVMQAKDAGARHLIAASSGNHGQAVASIAQTLQLPATIVVPEDANPAKVAAIEQYGGEVVRAGQTSQERIDKAMQLEKEKEAVYIPPYDDYDVMAGQGTIGLEVLSQVREPEIVIVPIGGGGLISGVATAIKSRNPNIRVIGVEPKSANDTYLSKKEGKRLSTPASSTIADGLRATIPGEMTFPIIQKNVDDIVLVTEDEIRHAFTFYVERMKQVIEPSGAVTLAALRAGKIENIHGKVVVVASGGNVNFKGIGSYLV